VGHAVGGAMGAPVVAKAKKWYKKIDLPPWTPPDFLFGPVWTMLYSAMGVPRQRECINERSRSPQLLWSYGIIRYFMLNLPWAPVFFGMKRLRLGLILNLLMMASLLLIHSTVLSKQPNLGISLASIFGMAHVCDCS
jgi:tryptophan-rich sensory protein